ncbi:unnamed protein product [Schistocephalus solidus]|uniref:Uncharacterized protein n=1 Tax=Schistocephalus solidus TaxID=70667 RepID=A0A183T6W2_SCHSO|nr:unnamed protein product [Schistocephalus solidus]
MATGGVRCLCGRQSRGNPIVRGLRPNEELIELSGGRLRLFHQGNWTNGTALLAEKDKFLKHAAIVHRYKRKGTDNSPQPENFKCCIENVHIVILVPTPIASKMTTTSINGDDSPNALSPSIAVTAITPAKTSTSTTATTSPATTNGEITSYTASVTAITTTDRTTSNVDSIATCTRCDFGHLKHRPDRPLVNPTDHCLEPRSTLASSASTVHTAHAIQSLHEPTWSRTHPRIHRNIDMQAHLAYPKKSPSPALTSPRPPVRSSIAAAPPHPTVKLPTYPTLTASVQAPHASAWPVTCETAQRLANQCLEH